MNMLLWQSKFFVPLVLGLGLLAWFGYRHAQSQRYTSYLAVLLPAWLAASSAFFLFSSSALRWQGQSPSAPAASAYIREFSAFGFAYLVPFVALAFLLLSRSGRGWSREAHVIWAFVVGALGGFVSPILLVLSACWLQDNCL